MKQNYNNNNRKPPFKKGNIRDIVTPLRPKVHRIRREALKDVADDLYIDLVQVFANYGITLSNVHSLAVELVKRGWAKHKKIEDPKEKHI